MLEAVVPTEPLKSTITPALLPELATPPVSPDAALEDEELEDVEDAAAAAGAGVAVVAGATVVTGAAGATVAGAGAGAVAGAVWAGVAVAVGVVTVVSAVGSVLVVVLEAAGALETTNKGADAVTLVVFTLVTTGAAIEA